MKFKQIVVLDDAHIIDNFIVKLKNFSENKVRVFNSDPKENNEIIERLDNADCALLSWRTPINKGILSACKNLKFICLCGTNSDCIDLEECRKRNIVVSNIFDYGDEGVVEYIFFQLLNLIRGFGRYKWKSYPAELSGKTMGIIGLGVVGKLLANAALGFKMKVLYNSKTRNPEWEKRGLIFVDKEKLLKKSDFISLHIPRNVKILEKDDFKIMKEKILINTALGKTFDEEGFEEWIKQPNNYAIMDAATSKDFYNKFHNLDRVIFSDFVSGTTKESILRLNQKVLDNITSYLAGKPINKLN
ncbi:MAG: NAD(P)-dependent oxidoreductase [Candidatus Nanoarchaeia archaeon]|nr:NAD(P)-dependent oxidoreductase [Candidatus Nanoarchaeia archaeon]MDD5741014.1 NAD(P)-dependent oxidoreductase [Candidatus Nanoarchaeia archaeon]